MDRPTIIVTGASHGIGAVVAVIAAEKGLQVVLSARNRDALEKLAGQITQRGGSACVIAGYISDYEVCQTIVRQAVQSFGRIDAVINNAGAIGPLSLVADLHPEEWKRTLEVDLLGPVWLCREAVPYLRQTNGRVLNISSGGAVALVLMIYQGIQMGELFVSGYSVHESISPTDLSVLLRRTLRLGSLAMLVR
jgi:NAD(P)-dependent dehydrogenase (short-subunit alcohol dehydrogenase family)